MLNIAENEPLIPATTGILLTTNSALVPQPSESDPTLEVNTHAHLRYFDRPEVLEAYRKQLHIQTPDFVLLSESAGVGGRFRPRGLEDVRYWPSYAILFLCSLVEIWSHSKRSLIPRTRSTKNAIASSRSSRSVNDCARRKN
jgi:hypothetical protein